MKNNKDKADSTMVLGFVAILVVIGLLVFMLMKNADNKTVENNAVSTTETPQSTSESSKNTISNNSKTGAEQTPASSKKPMEQTAKKGDTLVVNYTGRLTNGTVFDSNVDPKFHHVEPFVFTLGAGQVIQGWDEGFLGMKVGEKKTLTIPPEKAYGTRGQGSIPPNSTLVFDVELVGIK
jgi:peptidylprolyl isomerase